MTAPARQLPASNVTSFCHGCGAQLLWAYTVAGPNGPGGKLMPLDPLESLASGNVAVTAPRRGRLNARVLAHDEYVDRPAEYAASTHFATCPAGAHPTPPPMPQDDRPRSRRRR